MITLEYVYVFAGLVFGAFAVLSAFDRSNKKRLGNAAFWGLFAASFLFGSHLSDLQNGILVLALVAIGGFNLLGKGTREETTPAERRASAEQRGNWLFVPALIIPVTVLLGTLFLKDAHIGGTALLDGKQVTIISLGLGVALSLIAAMAWLRPPLLAPLQEGRRLADTVGWAMLLPQMLASLGAVFALSGVGGAVGHIATDWLPLDTPFAAVLTYCIGMALFTAIMGNAFAAFPVMTAAIGLPLIVHKFGGDVVVMASIGMLSGFCGTLVTPMAANFNIVPAALLELPDRNGVIKVQVPTAIMLLTANTALMYFCVYRF
ncbi:MAG TPA: DUF979 domain-containing protein [Rhizomicrobium sp.]|jgi:uncharacterized membrane protein|nr:DUF979 domain-containing protein [Rhizomicrobium sp.]